LEECLVNGQLSKRDFTMFHQNINKTLLTKLMIYLFIYTQPKFMFYAQLNTI
jgi:hypothetical protein